MIGFPKPRPAILTTLETQREVARLKRAVYTEVDARDQKRCRCCGRRGNPNATTALGRIHRAHLQDASLGGAISSTNLISACWICHALVHAKQLFIIGKDANARVTFEIHEAAVVDVFGNRPLPPHVRIITASRRTS